MNNQSTLLCHLTCSLAIIAFFDGNGMLSTLDQLLNSMPNALTSRSTVTATVECHHRWLLFLDICQQMLTTENSAIHTTHQAINSSLVQGLLPLMETPELPLPLLPRLPLKPSNQQPDLQSQQLDLQSQPLDPKRIPTMDLIRPCASSEQPFARQTLDHPLITNAVPTEQPATPLEALVSAVDHTQRDVSMETTSPLAVTAVTSSVIPLRDVLQSKRF